MVRTQAPVETREFGPTAFQVRHLRASVFVVCTLRYDHSVSNRKTFEQPDPNDPTLAVDNLADLLPYQTDAEVDQTLTVGMLQDFYPARPSRSVAIVDANLPAASDLALNADSLDDYFPDRNEVSTFAHYDDSALTVENLTVDSLTVENLTADSLAVEHLTVEGVCVESEIHRAAVDFQRFAAKFHVFANECQRGASQAA